MMTTVFQEGPPVRGLVDQGGLGFDRPAVFHLLVIVSTVVLRQTSSLIPCIYLLSPLLDPSNMFLVLKTLFKVKTQEISRLLAVPDRPDLRYGTGRFFCLQICLASAVVIYSTCRISTSRVLALNKISPGLCTHYHMCCMWTASVEPLVDMVWIFCFLFNLLLSHLITSDNQYY